MERFSVPAYDERRHEGLIPPCLSAQQPPGETLCALVANATRLPHEAELIGMLRQAEPKLQGIVLSVNQKRTNVILGTAYRTLWGAAHLQERLCGLDFQLSVPSFFQVNRAQTEFSYQRAAELPLCNATKHSRSLLRHRHRHAPLGQKRRKACHRRGEIVTKRWKTRGATPARTAFKTPAFLSGDAGCRKARGRGASAGCDHGRPAAQGALAGGD